MKESNSKRGFSRRTLFGGAALAGAGASIAPKVTFASGEDESLPQVPRRRLGKTEQTVPILLMGGSMNFDQRFDPKFAECVRFGVNYFDVADCYAGGTSETALGNFHTRLKNRDKIWITSKSDAHDPEGFTRTVEQSLDKLKTNYIDLYFLHSLKNGGYLNSDIAKTAERLKKEGKIKYFGFSCHSHNVVELMNQASQLDYIDAIMFRYNFRQYGDKALNEAIDACKKVDIGLIAMKTQGSEASFADAWKKFEKTGKWTKHQAVMKAVWADERISAAVSAMKTFKILRENIAAAVDRTELTRAEMDALHQYADATRPFACDGCDHLCNPAVDAPVQIGDVMRYVMYHDVYGDLDEAKRRFATLPAEARTLTGVDFEGANRACPHGVDVAYHMKRAAHIFDA
ncbi:MAG: aldo/keto reductase [Myxococcota bacterium]